MNQPQFPNQNEPDEPDELEKFIRLLDRLRDACGRPSLRELSRVSRTVKKLYGGRYPKLPELSLTALSDVLGCRRKNPPTWNWVASYVLSCQRYAAESGVRPDPKDATLPTWHLRLQALHRSDVKPPEDEQMIPGKGDGHLRTPPSQPSSPPRSSRPPSTRREPLSAPTPLDGPRYSEHEVQDRHGDRPAGTANDIAATGTAVQIVELEAHTEAGGPSLTEQRFFRLYGTHGVDLLRNAEDRRDHDAEYRLGVLLCVDDRPQESLAWLLRADAGGHAKARELIEDPAPRRAALGHAWQLGTQDAQDDYEIATLYLERAAQKGHADAAFELGALHMGREEPECAAAWFRVAAESGHPLVGWSSHRSRVTAGPGGEPAVPTVDELLGRLYGKPSPARSADLD